MIRWSLNYPLDAAQGRFLRQAPSQQVGLGYVWGSHQNQGGPSSLEFFSAPLPRGLKSVFQPFQSLRDTTAVRSILPWRVTVTLRLRGYSMLLCLCAGEIKRHQCICKDCAFRYLDATFFTSTLKFSHSLSFSATCSFGDALDLLTNPHIDAWNFYFYADCWDRPRASLHKPLLWPMNMHRTTEIWNSTEVRGRVKISELSNLRAHVPLAARFLCSLTLSMYFIKLNLRPTAKLFSGCRTLQCILDTWHRRVVWKQSSNHELKSMLGSFPKPNVLAQENQHGHYAHTHTYTVHQPRCLRVATSRSRYSLLQTNYFFRTTQSLT